MYRVAVIQNEIEMQHSGYVDSVPYYIRKFYFNTDVAFNRFSSVNIHSLFREGEDFLLDYDCLILGTNATSDENVYNFLQNPDNKSIIEAFIQQGKGLLICSQKKLAKDDTHEGYNVRKTNFLPDDYEYNVISRPKEESSADGDIQMIGHDGSMLQSYMLNIPHQIKDNIVRDRCINNDFQTHYYRDFIVPRKESLYFPLLVDQRVPARNTLMVASPRKKEKIVISTMALDWAGHYKLIENIVNYLMIGIPEVAFVTTSDDTEEVSKFLVSDARLAKIPHEIYTRIESVKSSRLYRYHSLFVFSPGYKESEVSEFWDSIKGSPRHARLLHYRHANDDPSNDLVLVNFSQSRQIDSQKQAVETWLLSLYSNGLWDGSFWKSYDVILALNELNVSIEPFIGGLFDDIGAHYRSGSYDGVLAPTCGLFEILSLIASNESYSSKLPNVHQMLEDTTNWLIAKFRKTSSYDKKFIIRSFHRTGSIDKLKRVFSSEEDFLSELHGIATADTNAIKDKFEIDLCLDIETCLIYNSCTSNGDEQDVKKKIKECLEVITQAQQQNGRWDNNLGKTSRILLFLIKNEQLLSLIDREISKYTERGVNALRKTYNNGNWENDIVTTANAIRVLVLSDQRAKYRSKDFFSQINHEVRLASSYGSLRSALKTLGHVLELHSRSQIEIKSLYRMREQYKKSNTMLYVFANVTVVLLLLLVSYFVYLRLEDPTLFTRILSESLAWVPIAIAITITTGIGLLFKVTKRFFDEKRK